jgi:hypothetical protein
MNPRYTTGLDWGWIEAPGVKAAQLLYSDATSSGQSSADEAAQFAAQQEKIRQEQATQELQSTVEKQAQAQGAQAQAEIAPTLTTLQLVGWVVAGAAVLGVTVYILRGKK